MLSIHNLKDFASASTFKIPTIVSLFILYSFSTSSVQAQMQLSKSTGFPGINKDFQLLVHVPIDSTSREPIVDDALINGVLADVSKYFKHIGANFDRCEKNIIGNYTYATPVDSIRFLELKTLNSKPYRINVYFLESIPFAYCGSSTFDGIQTSDDANIFIERDCPDGYANQLAHHLGHLFGLEDTYTTGNELVNGSNCTTAGDKICDTPADPFFRFVNTDKNELEAFIEALPFLINDCEYIGNITDANNEPYDPDLTNIMSAYPCKCQFTDNQLRKIVANWKSSLFKQF